MATFTDPSIDDFAARFARDFPYDSTSADAGKVWPADVRIAMNDASMLLNTDLFSTQADYTTAYLYLVAHFLVVNLRSASQGLASGMPWLASSKSAGPASVSYAIPQEILNNPLYAGLSLTPYGLRYLSLVLGLLAGNVGVVGGQSLP